MHFSIYKIQLSTLSKASKCWKAYNVKSLLVVRAKWLELDTNATLLGQIFPFLECASQGGNLRVNCSLKKALIQSQNIVQS